MSELALEPKTQATPRSPQPAAPVRQYSFTDFQVNNPTAPPPGDRLDGEYDRTNGALTDTITWVSTSLNSDGSLKSGSVGKSQMEPGLFNNIGVEAKAIVEPLVSRAEVASGIATAAAGEADASAFAAAGQNELAQDAAARAEVGVLGAAEDAASAAQSALEAAASANDASNSANHADLSEAVCIDYGVLTQAWAEHMPDTIPPNILAVMDVTGDHWSSRWWANRAHLIVEEDTANAICDLQHYWMGAYPAPPTVNNCGEPVVAGAMYFNTTEKVSQVYDGVEWHDVTQPVPGQIDEYLYLPAAPTTVFSGVDYRGNTLVLDPFSAEIAVYLNGVKLLEGLDYSVSPSAITMLLGPVTTPNSVEVMSVNDSTRRPPAQGVKVNTTPWVFNGATVTFPLKDSVGTDISPPGATDCIVSLNGVIQEPGVDFTVNPGFITFTAAPEADADRFMVVGVPIGGVAEAAPWTPFTPAVTASTGAFTTVSAAGRFKRAGKIVYLQLAVTVTTNGTASGFVRATLPAGMVPASAAVLAGVTATQISLNALIANAGTYAQLARYDGTYPGANGAVLTVSGVYEAV